MMDMEKINMFRMNMLMMNRMKIKMGRYKIW